MPPSLPGVGGASSIPASTGAGEDVVRPFQAQIGDAERLQGVKRHHAHRQTEPSSAQPR